jgi:hypothetical protein
MHCIFCIRMHRLHYTCFTTAFADCISLHMHSMHFARDCISLHICIRCILRVIAFRCIMHSMHSIAFPICTFQHTLHCNFKCIVLLSRQGQGQ